MIISFVDEYKINISKFEETGAFDPILGVDTRLFIDPSLIRDNKIPEFKNAYSKIQNFFEKIIRLLKQAKVTSKSDIFWKGALNVFKTNEIKGFSIGYSSNTQGSGIGEKKKLRILTNIKAIIDAGNDDPAIFELVGAFEDGVGPDLISDMITNILIEELVAYTQRVSRELGVELKELKFSKYYKAESLPENPYSKEPIILIPKVFLRDLPIANEFADLDWIKSHNDDLRIFFNQLLGDAYKSVTLKEKKYHVKNVFITHPDLLKDLLGAYLKLKPDYYDFEEDKTGEVVWYRTAQKVLADKPLELSLNKMPSSDDVYQIVEKICLHFKDLIENNGLSRLLYDDKDKRKHESAAQLLFFGIACAYCYANNLDLSPEADAGRGPVDFKISVGSTAKVLVEVKLTSNNQLAHGFEKQLPIYQKAEKSQKGIYLVLYNEGITPSRWNKFNELVKNSKIDNLNVIIVNAIPKASASIADE
ncbi:MULTISPECIES: hypothetical protein [Acinetobacter]|jgi:hypothetical protein|uniref:hypothetical protein n=1 Tax=Acinetobacter TaxID=469 RepID=UPI0022E3F6BC|nr:MULTISPECIES: hypothetical protein [Acinetobacter]MDI1224319.1 hypothetical protein [Acinetobacter sp.]